MKNCIFLTNIPAPYRVVFYNRLKKSFDFEVWYMKSEVKYRPNWFFNKKTMKHKYFINNGFFKKIGSFDFYFNPRLIFKILINQPKNLILATSWNDLDTVIICILKRLKFIKSKITFWSEANYLTNGARKNTFFKYHFRKFIYSSTNVQISSGKMTELTFYNWGLKNNKYIRLPNTINEDLFDLKQGEENLRKNLEMPIFLIPARLIESIKGQINFFSKIPISELRKSKFLLAGDGPDRQKLEKFIIKNNLKENIEILGHQDYQSLKKIYSQVNCLCLPSFSDQSPLSLIEGLKMKLPLLVSNRCGNHFETVLNDINGLTFDPSSEKSVATNYKSIIKKFNEFNQMGKKSHDIYNNKFQLDKVISEFIFDFNKYMKV